MTYDIVYNYTGHAEILSSHESRDEAEDAFNQYVSHWMLEPHDQFLELTDEDGEELMVHTFNEGNWESED